MLSYIKLYWVDGRWSSHLTVNRVGLGLWKQQQHLRIAGMVLFGITLVKLFFYDIAHLDTIAKTVVLVSLGILLLLISFLYNKYRERV